MAKKKQEPLTEEQKLEQERQRCINSLKTEHYFINEPTYTFKVGDSVKYGGMKAAVVEEVYDGGKMYLLRCTQTNANYGHPYDSTTYRMVTWVDVRPLQFGDSDFTTNDDIRLYFNNSTVESLIHRYYHFGVDMDPEYQRGYVWTMEDKLFLIDSIFANIDIGKFVFVRVPDEKWHETNISYEVLDGKQRLNAIIEYYENRYPYKGKYYNDLSAKDRRTFMEKSIASAELTNADQKTVYKCFLMLNRGGRQMDKEHLDKVAALLAKA